MTNRHTSTLDVLLTALKEAAPETPLTDVLATVTSAMASARTVTAPQHAALALSHHRELLTRFIATTGVDLVSNHEAAALLTQLHALANDIHTHIDDAHIELASACEGMEMFLHLTNLTHREALNASHLRCLLAPLHQQFDRATRAVGSLL